METASKTIIRSKADLIDIFKYANDRLREAGVTVGMPRFVEFSNLLFLKLISEKMKKTIMVFLAMCYGILIEKKMVLSFYLI
ncbi:hypothetical protein ACGO3R_09340 [Lactococcus lactis]